VFRKKVLFFNIYLHNYRLKFLKHFRYKLWNIEPTSLSYCPKDNWPEINILYTGAKTVVRTVYGIDYGWPIRIWSLKIA